MLHNGTLIFKMFVLAILLTVSNSATNTANAKQADTENPTIQYVVDLTDAKNHYLKITADIPVEGETTELMMAVWTPGSYLIREFARHVDSMEVTSDGGNLDFEKTNKNRWLVQTRGLKSFRVRYRLYCNEMTVRTNWIGNEFAMLNGAPTFITVPDRLDRPHIVQLKMPKHWTRSATSLQPTGDTPHIFVAENFDELVDSPIVAGNIHIYPFTAGNVEHQLVNIGESGIWDGTKAAIDLKRIVEAHQEMWGVVPYDRYLFLNMISETRGGLEHDYSTLIMTSRWNFRDDERYNDWLSLASHEFFHTWNVRRLRPQSLVSYDYENEVYTDSMWIAEGITSYYEDLALVRSGLIDRKEFLSRLSANIKNVQNSAGRNIQSLQESSFDTWIKFYRPDENSSNTRISYYSKGAVVAFLLDLKIRKSTQGKKSLDDVMRTMFTSFSETGYTNDDFRNTASEVAGEDLTEWFGRAVNSTNELDYSDVEFPGIAVPNTSQETVSGDDDPGESGATEDNKQPGSDSGEKKPDGETAEDSTTKKQDKPQPWLGVTTSVNNGRLTISRIKPDSPATTAGLNTADEIIAVNGYRVTESIDSRLEQYLIGDEIEILIARRGKLATRRMIIGSQEPETWELRLESTLSDDQQRQLDLWLGTQPEAPKQ